MAVDSWSLVGRLKRAVKKIKFLLDFNVNRWKLASLIGASSSKRRLSFTDRPGIRACLDDSEPDEPGSARSLQRTISYPTSEDDVDKKADAFIANFYKQLQIERQVSLELRYYRGDSFTSAKSP
ncbi:cotton fiber protein [Perilla frutescens var. hirtella]|uniref:Cotton fiber protein n=1 Tax=Perilla frutescens var. hirtella TaxID=608512 RepID=A0AAD4JK94_PERFH|nr:cotton fiber protein [Perilla frutescens var. hirtella]KAH6817502.1 cotton fiber protein [Perilla frutescens var. frutescens]KAH6818582.1 cotton fiber protein [Perilla frutescens var. frutescens]KAH6835394.1 cotton fiber protein [Perilla frutescens var. hirtella]